MPFISMYVPAALFSSFLVPGSSVPTPKKLILVQAELKIEK
jgi:hypothetical protein